MILAINGGAFNNWVLGMLEWTSFYDMFVLLFCWKPLWRSWLKNDDHDDDDGGENEDAYEY